MSVSPADFWKLIIDSRLLTVEQCQLLSAEYTRVKGAADQGNVKTLAEWLISRNALTAYQSLILQAGRSGPFHYGDYKVYDRVDQGRLAGMFRAIHEPTSHPVLLQFVTGAATQNAALWGELAEYVERQCGINHPHLHRVGEAVDLVSYKFVAQEDLRGESLERRLSASGKLRPNDACRVARAAALAMSAIHESGLAHGDVRPGNLWLDSTGHVRLLRDPLARPQSLYQAQSDASGQLLARADYLAPEMARHDKQPDVLTDVYSLGCTLYHLLSGQAPFAGGDVMQKLNRHATEAIRPLDQLGVPAPIAQMVAYMMAKNSQVRYQQAAVVAEQLAQFVDPAQRNLQPPPAPQSLGAYQTWIKQKQSALAAQSPAPSFGFPGVSDSPRGGVATLAAPRVSAAAPTAARGTSAVPAFKPQTSSAQQPWTFAGMSKKNLIMLGSGTGALVVLVIGLIIFFNSHGSREVAENTEPNQTETGTSEGGVTPVGTDGGASSTSGGGVVQPVVNSDQYQQSLAADNGQLLWASPTAGTPISFDYLPPAGQIFLIARPAEIVANPNGNEVLQKLGPAFESARRSWETAAGLELKDIAQVIIGLHDNDGAAYRPSFVVRLVSAKSEADLLQRWGNPSSVPVPEGDTNYYKAANGWAFFIPRPPLAAADTGVNVFVMGNPADVVESAKVGTAPPLLRRQVSQLLLASDANRHFTVLFTPNALFNDEGQKLFGPQFAKTLDPLSWLLGDGIMAGMLSMHFGNELYVELRLKSELGKDPFKLVEELRGRLNQVPAKVENYTYTLNVPMYWKPLSTRFPLQIAFLHDHARIGVEEQYDNDKQAVINSVLPPNAAPNLIVASELVIASQPGASTAVAATAAKTSPKTIEELLQVKTSIDIPQQDLVLAVGDVKDDMLNTYRDLPFKFDIKLMGPDLKEEGITQNQKVLNFKMDDKSLADVLTGLALTANIIKTVKDPSEEDQKLVWVIAPDPTDPNNKILIFTTRKAAARDKLELPKAFHPK